MPGSTEAQIVSGGIWSGFRVHRCSPEQCFLHLFQIKICLVFSNSLLLVFFIILGTSHTNNVSFPNAIKRMPLKLKNLPAAWLLLEPQPTCRYGWACCKYNLSLSFPDIYPCFTKTIHTDPKLVTYRKDLYSWISMEGFDVFIVNVRQRRLVR